ncbi:MAG: RluA family pseudouridine synthase [Mariniblastus sp.]
MRPRPEKLNVLFEDNHLLVVNKPALLPTMGVKEGELSLLSQSRQYIKEKYDKPGNVYLGIVSRLDAFVSGVIVLAKTSKAAGRLSEQFRNRSANKTYWAIVPDALKQESGKLEDWVIKNESLHRMTVVPKGKKSPAGAKIARLNYKTLGIESTNRQAPTKLIEIKLETGRKHQIRVQLENAGASILGDRKYGSDLPFKRGIALHSRELSIEHPTKRVIQSFQAETPSWWNIHRYSLS